MNKIKIFKKIKLSKKIVVIILSIIIVLLMILLIINKEPYVGKIKDGKAIYTERIVSVDKIKDKVIIEFNNNLELIDNCIITSVQYDKLINDDPEYNIIIKNYYNLMNLSSKENYNINKALQLGIIKEDDYYWDYFAKTCGFDNKKELIKYTKAVINLANKEK